MQSGDKTIERVYNYLCDYISKNQISPSVRDICAGVGLKSTSSVHTYLKQLDSLGRIEYRPGLRRAIVIKQNSNSTEQDLSDSASVTELNDYRNIPVIGKITAGIPILAYENYTDSFPVGKSIIGDSEAFMLRVSGESMIEAGILDGDYILVRRQNSAENGTIVVALIEDEATVKTFYKEKDHIRLQPQNSTMDPIIVPDCQILGIVIGVFRKL